MDLLCPFSCQLHNIAFDRLKSHAPLPCPGTQSINIPLKFHCVFFILNFNSKHSHQQTFLFQTQYLLRCHLCTERTTRDRERYTGGHPTKPEPSQILLHLQQLVVVGSKENNLSISMSCHMSCFTATNMINRAVFK